MGLCFLSTEAEITEGKGEGRAETRVLSRVVSVSPARRHRQTRMKTCSPIRDSPLRLFLAQDNLASSRKPGRNACEWFLVLK